MPGRYTAPAYGAVANKPERIRLGHLLHCLVLRVRGVPLRQRSGILLTSSFPKTCGLLLDGVAGKLGTPVKGNGTLKTAQW